MIFPHQLAKPTAATDLTTMQWATRIMSAIATIIAMTIIREMASAKPPSMAREDTQETTTTAVTTIRTTSIMPPNDSRVTTIVISDRGTRATGNVWKFVELIVILYVVCVCLFFQWFRLIHT